MEKTRLNSPRENSSSVKSASVEVIAELCREEARLPERARAGDSGFDLFAAQDVSIAPGQTVLIPTGIKLAIPFGYEAQVRPRSGLSLKTPLRIPNAPGTIDAGYREEIGVIMTNTSAPSYARPRSQTDAAASGGLRDAAISLDDDADNASQQEEAASFDDCRAYLIKKGDRIAQLTFHAVPDVIFRLAESVSAVAGNRGGGFGHTGVRGVSEDA